MREPEPLSNGLHGHVVAGAFRPHPLFGNPHLQTLAPYFRPMPKLVLDVQRRELPDGDFVDLGWVVGAPFDTRPAGATQDRPLAILLHGLSGGFESKYARGTANELIARGWRVVILQFRGAGPEPNRLPRSYHHGDTQDLRELVQMLREREPDTRLFAVGWSLGGNVLLKYLGEEGDRTALSAAVAVSVPFCLRPCAEKLRTGFSRIYQNHLLGELKKMVRRKQSILPPEVDLAQIVRARDFFDFDNSYTALLNNFKDAEDYYARAACGQYLGGIRRPTLAIHAQDDPFMVPEIIPESAHLPPCVTLELCERGGHVGFVAAGPGLRPRWWLEERIPVFLEEQRRTAALQHPVVS
jgi:uncharacterized protein